MPHFNTLRHTCLALSLVSLTGTGWAAEKDELALVIKQLEQVQAALERARVVAVQDSPDGRFYFDYDRVSQDVNTVKKGVAHYLEPSRAQPQIPADVIGQYRQEHP